MFTFKKCSKRLKRTVCVALCLIVLSSLLVIPAGAVDFAGDFQFQGNGFIDSQHQSATSLYLDYPLTSGSPTERMLSSTSLEEQLFSYEINKIVFNDINIPLNGNLGVYVSWFFRADFENSFVSNPTNFVSLFARLYQVDGTNVLTNVSSLKFSPFNPSHVDGSSESKGVVLKGRISGLDTIMTVSRLQFGGFNHEYSIYKPAGVPGALSVVVPSAVLISGDSSTLDGLESVADGIAAQSQIMSQYYGDIMELLNDLYTRLGDLQAVQETANAYFAQLIPLVNSINTNTSNIHSLLQTQFQLLRTLIATESGNIQDAVEQQTQDLIAYFDTVLSGSTGSMPEKSDDLESSVGNFNDAESQYQSNASQRFNELSANFSGFSGGTLAGITLAANLFSRVWNALGEYNIVYYFPLLLGLSLVIIGRLPRGSGGQSSAEKHRGDSSA